MDADYLYVIDSANHLVRLVDISTQEVTTFAGIANTSGLVDGKKTAAQFNTPYRTVKIGTTVYVADTFNHAIRTIK